MLSLKRCVGQSIYIKDDIIIKILSIHKGQVRFGIEAPKEVPVDREEIYYRKKQTGLEEENSNDE